MAAPRRPHSRAAAMSFEHCAGRGPRGAAGFHQYSRRNLDGAISLPERETGDHERAATRVLRSSGRRCVSAPRHQPEPGPPARRPEPRPRPPAGHLLPLTDNAASSRRTGMSTWRKCIFIALAHTAPQLRRIPLPAPEARRAHRPPSMSRCRHAYRVDWFRGSSYLRWV
jgi:hypothetical protein